MMTAAAISHRAIVAVRGVNVTLRRGSRTVAVAAVAGSTEFEVLGDDGGSSAANSVDFIVEAALLAPFGLPKVEDRVEWGEDLYEVRSPGDLPVYKFCDSGKSVIRIYTSQVA